MANKKNSSTFCARPLGERVGVKGLIAIFFALFFSSCQQNTFSSKDELWAYLKTENNGYHIQKTVNDIHYGLTYKPTDLLVQQELKDEYSDTEVAQLRKKYGNYLYFNLSMSANGQELLNQKVGNRAEFGAMVNQLAFGMAEKVNLINQKQDTLPLLDYVYPRMYGMGNSTDMLLVYEKNPRTLDGDYLRLTLEDMGFKTGEVAFKMNTEQIINQPQLKF